MYCIPFRFLSTIDDIIFLDYPETFLYCPKYPHPSLFICLFLSSHLCIYVEIVKINATVFNSSSAHQCLSSLRYEYGRLHLLPSDDHFFAALKLRSSKDSMCSASSFIDPHVFFVQLLWVARIVIGNECERHWASHRYSICLHHFTNFTLSLDPQLGKRCSFRPFHTPIFQHYHLIC